MNSVDFNSLKFAIFGALFTLRIKSSRRLLVYRTELRCFSVISGGFKPELDKNSEPKKYLNNFD